MQNLMVRQDYDFTESDKMECIPIINKILDLSKLARVHGVLALESEMRDENNFFLKTGIDLVVDGTDPECVKEILQNLVCAENHSGVALLSRLLIMKGVLSIQQGENPRIIALKLSSILGEKYVLQINDEFMPESKQLSIYYKFLETIKDKECLVESVQLEAALLQMNNRLLQVVLRDIDSSCLLSALHGFGYELVQKILENMSLKLCLSICVNWESTKILQKDAILKSHQEISSLVDMYSF